MNENIVNIDELLKLSKQLKDKIKILTKINKLLDMLIENMIVDNINIKTVKPENIQNDKR